MIDLMAMEYALRGGSITDIFMLIHGSLAVNRSLALIKRMCRDSAERRRGRDV